MGMCGDVISSPSQLWKLMLYAAFPSFLISQMTTIVILVTGAASLEDTASPHAHAGYLSLFFIPFLPPHTSPQLDTQTMKIKLKKNNRDTLKIFLFVKKKRQ